MISIFFYKFLATITFKLFLVYEADNGGKVYRFGKKIFVFESNFIYFWLLNTNYKAKNIPAKLTILNKNNELFNLSVHLDNQVNYINNFSKNFIYQKILDFRHDNPFYFLNDCYHQKFYNQLKNDFKNQSLRFKVKKILCHHYGFFHYLSLTIEARDASDLMILMKHTDFKIFDGDLFQNYNFSSNGKKISNDILEISKYLHNIDIYSNRHAPEICYGLNQSEIEVMYFDKDKFYKSSFLSNKQVSFIEVDLENLVTVTLPIKDINLKKFVKDLSISRILESPKGILYEKLNEFGITDNLITENDLTVLEMVEY